MRKERRKKLINTGHRKERKKERKKQRKKEGRKEGMNK
jgi:hypothetical protein